MPLLALPFLGIPLAILGAPLLLLFAPFDLLVWLVDGEATGIAAVLELMINLPGAISGFLPELPDLLGKIPAFFTDFLPGLLAELPGLLANTPV